MCCGEEVNTRDNEKTGAMEVLLPKRSLKFRRSLQLNAIMKQSASKHMTER